METYDIAAANRRQSDFLWGWNDAQAHKPMRTDISEDYVRGYRARKGRGRE
jgi:hypothetical protein